MPFVVRWPAKAKPGTSDALMSQMDLLASFAALTGQTVPKGQAPDSENHLDALLGAKKTGREFLVEQSNGGAPFGFRHGAWKLVPGGPKAKEAGAALFDLATDLSEAKNVAAANPDRVAAMRAKLAEVTGQPLPKKGDKPEDE